MSWAELCDLWLRALDDTGDGALPVDVALGIAVEHHGSPLTLYASAAPSIGDVVKAFVAYWPTVTDAFAWSWHPDADGGSVVGHGPGSGEGEAALMTFIGVEAVVTGRRATRERWRPRNLSLPWDAAPDRRLGVTPLPSAAAVQIGLSGADLDVTPRHSDPSLSRMLEVQLQRDAPVQGASVSDRVRRELWLAFDGPPGPRAVPDLSTVARRLGRSERSLHRDLAKAGMSYRKVLDQVRADIAATWLPRSSIADVSERLGYGEPRAFHRAFRRWHGISPAQWLTDRSLPR